jgi:putative transcriptional regulator
MRGWRPWLALAGVFIPAALFAAAPSNPDVGHDNAFLTGQLLVASETMGDPRFRHTVLVMVRHNAEGAMALIINRPIGEQPVVALLEAIGEKSEGVTGTVPIYEGGPVERERGFVLHSSDYRRDGTLSVTADVSVTASPEIFRDIAGPGRPGKFLVAFGYAGWAAGQLENEILHNAWSTIPFDIKLVFDADRDKLWERALERRTRDL